MGNNSETVITNEEVCAYIKTYMDVTLLKLQEAVRQLVAAQQELEALKADYQSTTLTLQSRIDELEKERQDA